jgi:hypothetical protein
MPAVKAGDFVIQESSLGEPYFWFYQQAAKDSPVCSVTCSHRAIVDLVQVIRRPDVTKEFTVLDLKAHIREGEEIANIDEIVEDSLT